MADWIPDAIAKVQAFAELPDNWDSYGGVPGDPEAIGKAIGLLWNWPANVPEPDALVPTGHGGVGFAWSDPEIEFEIEPGTPTFASGVIGCETEFTDATLADLCKRLSEIFGDG